MIDIRKRLGDIKRIITSLELFEKHGWEATYGLSQLNSTDRYDDLIAKTEFVKTYHHKFKYELSINKMKIIKQKKLTSLPDLIGKCVDVTDYYKLTGKEFLDDDLISDIEQQVISEFPYFDALNTLVSAMSILEHEGKIMKDRGLIDVIYKKLKEDKK